MVAMNPVDRMGDPGIGLDKVDHRVLNYRDLCRAGAEQGPAHPVALPRNLSDRQQGTLYVVVRRGQVLGRQRFPIRFAYDERVRVKLVNDTMMAHPIHLHGHFSSW